MTTLDPRAQRLGSEPLGRLVLSFSAPVIVTLVVNALYNLVDRVFVGRGVGPTALAGITVSFPLFMVVAGLGMWTGQGAGTLVSLALGRRDRERAEAALGTALIAGVAGGGVAVLAGYAFLRPLLQAFGGSGEVLVQAERFTSILLVGGFFQVLGMTLGMVIRSAGEPGVAFGLALAGTAVNLVLNPLFIFGLRMGVTGSALATSIAEVTGFLLALAHVCRTRSALRLVPALLVPRVNVLRELLVLGAPAFFMQLALMAVMAISNRAVAAHGGEAGIAVMGILYVIYPMVLLPLMGLSTGIAPVLGFNYGAGAMGRVRRALLIAIGAASAFCLAAWIPLLAWPTPLLRLFLGGDARVAAFGPYAVRVSFLLLPVVGAQVVGAGYFQAVGKAGVSLLANLLRQVFILLPLLLVLPRRFGLDGVWIASPISDALALVITLALLAPELRRLAAAETAVDAKAAERAPLVLEAGE